MKQIRITLADVVYTTIFSTALYLVARDLHDGQRTAIGVASALWLGAQAIGLGLQRLDLGMDERWLWRLFADQPDGSIKSVWRLRAAWLVHGVLDHFSLLSFPQGLRARGIVTKQTKRD